MKMLTLALALACMSSTSAFALSVMPPEIYNENRAIALVQAKYLHDISEQNATYDIAANNRGLVIVVERTSVGGPCNIKVTFNRDGSILVGNARCQDGS